VETGFLDVEVGVGADGVVGGEGVVLDRFGKWCRIKAQDVLPPPYSPSHRTRALEHLNGFDVEWIEIGNALSGLLPDREVLAAVAGEGLAGPPAPALA
jgi:hypothetical protein